MQNSPKKYWPYDEVSIYKNPQHESQVIFSAPWLKVQIQIDPAQMPKVEKILVKLSDQTATFADLEEISWLMTGVAKYPFAYVLPRPENSGSDQHELIENLSLENPKSALKELLKNTAFPKSLSAVLEQLSDQWTWDTNTALGFSQTPHGHDPASLFSIARRFHLLNDLENNKTADLFKLMSTLTKDSQKFRQGSALIMRQNHHITIQCEQVLRAALPLAQNAEEAILEFIQAESGHHQIIEKGMNHLGFKSEDIEVLDCVQILMELFERIGQVNLLAFSMVVDVFERSSYQKEDPFAHLLVQGGQDKAAKQMDIHRDINDAGEHENVALSFLEPIQAIPAGYAAQSLHLAELLTQVIHLVSLHTLEKIHEMK